MRTEFVYGRGVSPNVFVKVAKFSYPQIEAQASMAIKHSEMLAKKESTFARLSCLLNNLLPFSPIPWTWKTSFAKSMPIVFNIHDGRSAQLRSDDLSSICGTKYGGDHSVNKNRHDNYSYSLNRRYVFKEQSKRYFSL